MTPLVADFGSQYIIASRLAAAFPEDPVIAEEDLSSLTAAQRETLQELLGEGVGEVPVRVASKRTQRFWTVDPIDGTKGYLRHGQYAVCVALAACGSVLLSVLVCPRLACAAADAAGTIFIAIRSHGAFHVSLHTLCAQRLPLRAGAPAGGAVLAESFEPSHTDHAFSKGLVEALCLNPATVRMDSQCKYGLVARGDANIYLRRPTRPGYREKIWVSSAGLRRSRFAGPRARRPPRAGDGRHGHQLCRRAARVLARRRPRGRRRHRRH